jgi:hypothetical protein
MKKLLYPTACLLLLLATQTLAAPTKEDFRKLMFFATLETLYEQNISDATVDKLLTRDPETNQPISFVYACPVCTPVFDAFNLYRQRPKFWGNKAGLRQFSGEPGEWNELLALPDPKKRTAALGAFTKEALERKLQSMNLTDEEREQWNQLIVAAHDQGGKLLEEYKQSGRPVPSWMERCEICEGAEEASQD